MLVCKPDAGSVCRAGPGTGKWGVISPAKALQWPAPMNVADPVRCIDRVPNTGFALDLPLYCCGMGDDIMWGYVSTSLAVGLTLSVSLCALTAQSGPPTQKRARELGIWPGVLQPGPLNAITDVAGVSVGHVTLWQGDGIRTGVTAILPHGGNLYQQKVPAAVFVGNAFGKLAGSTQVEELGNLETPVVLTNTLSVAEGIAGIVEYTLAQPGNEKVRSVNAVVGETNDGTLNDIRKRYVTKEHVLETIRTAKGGPVEEGAVGAGTGTICFGFKGGIGTSSRQVSAAQGGYVVGVLVQTNYGGVLEINGAPVAQELSRSGKDSPDRSPDGSCMVVVATDAPLDARNLKRLAARAMLGLAKTGSYSSNGSGDFVIAFSTAPDARVPADPKTRTLSPPVLHNDAVSPLFQAVKEATEEAVYNSLFMAKTTSGNGGRMVEALPVDRVLEICRRYGAVRDAKK
jgi:D-aminopeptidase